MISFNRWLNDKKLEWAKRISISLISLISRNWRFEIQWFADLETEKSNRVLKSGFKILLSSDIIS